MTTISFGLTVAEMRLSAALLKYDLAWRKRDEQAGYITLAMLDADKAYAEASAQWGTEYARVIEAGHKFNTAAE